MKRLKGAANRASAAARAPQAAALSSLAGGLRPLVQVSNQVIYDSQADKTEIRAVEAAGGAGQGRSGECVPSPPAGRAACARSAQYAQDSG